VQVLKQSEKPAAKAPVKNDADSSSEEEDSEDEDAVAKSKLAK
jgi:hypothetical protein